MRDFQKLVVTGTIVNELEMKYTDNGVAYLNISLAHHESVKVGGEWKDKTTWFRVTLWGNMAENAYRFVSKGKRILVEGKIKSSENGNPNTWTADDGTTRASYEINAREVVFLEMNEKQENNADDLPEIDDSDGFDFF